MEKNLGQAIALFRYSLIAPLLTNTYTQKSQIEYLKEISAKKYDTPQGMKREYAPETIKEWLRLYRKHGIDGLYPKTRSDKGVLRKLSPAAKEFIVLSKQNSPKRSAKSIHSELIAKGYISFGEISLSTIQRFLSKADLTPKKLIPVERKAFEFEYPNDCWQSDISVGPYLYIEGKKHKTYIVAILDDASRLIVHAEAFYHEKLIALHTVLKKSVAKRGIPKKLFVDNGKVYKSGQMQLICAGIGTILCYARPYSPQSKGKIERWFRTLHDQWMNIIDWTKLKSLRELNESLYNYVEKYNNEVHSSIKESPIGKFMSNVDKVRFIPDKQELDYLFYYRVSRKVKNDSTISIDKIIFEVPMKFIGDKINIRYLPDNLDKAFIFSDEGKLLETIYPVNKIDNSKMRRNQNIKELDFSSFSAN